MRPHGRLFPIIGGGAALLALAAISAAQAGAPAPKLEDMEAFLASAGIAAVEKDVEPGRTVPWRVTLDDGRTQARALFKYIDRRTTLPTRHSYRYELAAYDLSRLLGLEIIPPVVEREIEGTTGSLQWYVENCWSERDRKRLGEEPPEPPGFLDRLAEVRIFEVLTADECGDRDDTLIHRDTWRVCRVDFSGAFRPSPGLDPKGVLERCSKQLFHRLETLTLPELRERLGDRLAPDEIGALFVRAQQVARTFRNLIRERGVEAVLFERKPPEP